MFADVLEATLGTEVRGGLVRGRDGEGAFYSIERFEGEASTIKRGAELAESAVLPPTLSLRVQGVRFGAYVLEEEEEA